MTEQEQAKFEGWGKLEAMGHQSVVGFISTQAFGQAVMFRVDVPELPERNVVLARPEYDEEGRLLPAGSTVTRSAVPGGSVLYGAASIYRITPSTEEVARKALESNSSRALKLVSLPPDKALDEPAGVDYDDRDQDDEDDEAPF